MLEQFLGRAAIAAADDQRIAWRWMRDGRRVNQVFMVKKFIAFGHHIGAVDAHQLAQIFGLEHLDQLAGRLHRIDARHRVKMYAGSSAQALVQAHQAAAATVTGKSLPRHTRSTMMSPGLRAASSSAYRASALRLLSPDTLQT